MAAEQTAEAWGPARGPSLPRLRVWLEPHTTGHTHAHIHTSARRRPLLPALASDLAALGWPDGRAPGGGSNSGQLLLSLQLAQHYPLGFSLSRPEPVNTLTQRLIAERLASGLDLSSTCGEFRSINSPVAAWVP